MNVSVMGTGHVGLVTCLTLAAIGHHVVGTDSDTEKIARLQKGEPPFFEPGLDVLLAEQAKTGRLLFTSDAVDAIRTAEAVFICVGTPPTARGDANLIAVEAASKQIASSATRHLVVIEKSTVPTGTATRIRRLLRDERPELDLEVVVNPEFLREGSAVHDSLHPDRILIGAEAEAAFELMREMYGPLREAGTRWLETNFATAELAKHACNGFLVLKISYANALARLAERTGADVGDIADVMGADPRIGRAFLNAGLGYGGSCFPKDLRAFERLAQSKGYRFPFLADIARVNEEAIQVVTDKVREALWNLQGKRVALMGLAFKPGTDDIRFSPAVSLADQLLQEGAEVVAFDPKVQADAVADIGQLEFGDDPYDAAAGAHCLVIATDWPEFTELDLSKLKEVMARPVIVDGRNIFKPEVMNASGFIYYGIGR